MLVMIVRSLVSNVCIVCKSKIEKKKQKQKQKQISCSPHLAAAQ